MLRLKTKLAAMLAVAMVLLVTAVTAPAALAATGDYTCKFQGTTYTITPDQYAQLVQLYGQKPVDAHCQPL